MATVTFSFRSKKDTANLEARLSYRISGNPNPISFYTRSKVEVSKDFWQDYTKGTKFKDVEKINLKKQIDDHTHNLRTFVLNEFDKTDINQINKDWFKKVVDEYYNPPQPEIQDEIPTDLIRYLDYYLKQKANDFSNGQRLKWGVVKHKIQRYQEAVNTTILIGDVNENFKNSFTDYCQKESYSQNTIQREFGFIKTLCRHARSKGVEVSPELDLLTIKKEKVQKIYLNPKEIKAIQELESLPEYLDNARDWLVISCYTGQRISDFMRFDKSMIRIENSVPILEFTQVKTGAEMAIPILPEVMTILNKRNGNFPRQISDQRYNEYIKEVCQLAELNKPTKGKISKNISESKIKTKMRKVLDEYPKWELVTSHIGRRSFATNFYGKIPTTFLVGITGHTTEKMFLNYIGKGQKDLVFDAYEYFKKMSEL